MNRGPVLLVIALCLTACSGADQSAALEWAASQRSGMIGRPAPLFSLSDQNDTTLSLESLRGRWVVLYFYPRDDTPGCTCQATEFTQLLQDFHDMNALILGLSPDSPGNHRYFIDKHHLRISLLSDPDHRVLKAYSAWSSDPDGLGGQVVRSTVLIDPQGRIAWHWPRVVPEGHAERVRKKLDQLQRTTG